MKEKLSELKDYIKNIDHVEQAVALVYWDMRTTAPKKALEQRGELLAYLSAEAYKLKTSDAAKELIEYFGPLMGKLDLVDKAMVEKFKKNYDEVKKIPQDRFREFMLATAKSEVAWEEAKEKSDYEIFKPHLKKIIDFKKEFIEYKGYNENKYDALLDDFEEGITVSKLDNVFSELRDAIVDLLDRIKASDIKINTEFMKDNYSKKEQDKFGRFVLGIMGYDFEAGRLDESVHPFTLNIGNKDVRLTTHYYENDLKSALFSTIHEGGHGIYEQNIPDELLGTGLAAGASMGIHESQSRFYENILGRSTDFWTYLYPYAQDSFPGLKNIRFNDFYKAINFVEPSLIRTEADELTYSLHIIIRYEIEKDLINDKITVDDLPKVWAEKYKEYLGVEPSSDSEGVLQDMHWSDGSFGYFPSYALGNLYGAQMLNKLKSDVPNIYEELQKGNMKPIYEWLKDNVHRYGAIYKPAELIYKVTGEELTAKYFIDYLREKYSRIYEL
ncbi:carboxypeptidase Taq [Clostridium cavendishii DSM 21758]|uniref:Metal-dependent carboxypeptidase n=1 Tax=Clostridium cavendishii DSM 21758 TaxID=1121302 RepID=A0A1M6SYC5_9CLOT|nr:carboxypeptidase M32 [Clostridium cavendishii]SHK49696.1 carboxypeptidase Taq [Clostridium cavendishii DSM 21758]